MLDEQTLFWIAAVVQTFGLASLIISRTGDALVAQRIGCILFYAAMLMVGCCGAMSLAIEGHGWLMSGITLGVMAVGGTVEFKPAAEPAAF